jgi:hypothetical protein
MAPFLVATPSAATRERLAYFIHHLTARILPLSDPRPNPFARLYNVARNVDISIGSTQGLNNPLTAAGGRTELHK